MGRGHGTMVMKNNSDWFLRDETSRPIGWGVSYLQVVWEAHPYGIGMRMYKRLSYELLLKENHLTNTA